MDRTAIEFLSIADDDVIDQIVRLLDVCVALAEVTEDWCCAYTAPSYKGRNKKNVNPGVIEV